MTVKLLDSKDRAGRGRRSLVGVYQVRETVMLERV